MVKSSYTAINFFSRKTIFKAKQHMIHMNLALALLLGLIVFVSGIETASDSKVGNVNHYYDGYHNKIVTFIITKLAIVIVHSI